MTTAGFALAAVLAASGAVPAEAAAGDCELHVWASPGLGTTLQTARDNVTTSYMGMVITSAEQNATRDNAPDHTLPATADSPLPTSLQLQRLRGLPLPELLGIPAYRVIPHDHPLDSQTLRTVGTRYAITKALCYADLVLSDVVFSREYAHGQNLKSFFRFREFTREAAPVRRLSTWAQTKLSFKRVGKKADIPASDAELLLALDQNVMKFAGYLAKIR